MEQRRRRAVSPAADPAEAADRASVRAASAARRGFASQGGPVGRRVDEFRAWPGGDAGGARRRAGLSADECHGAASDRGDTGHSERGLRCRGASHAKHMRTDGGSIMGLTLMITGAGGFLGRAVVAEAQERGLTRDDLDLSSGALPALDGVDCVVHLAGSLSGDWSVQARDTVEATRGVIEAMQAQPLPPRLVMASSIAVYSADAKGVVTEATPLEDRPDRRDTYARAKLAQEEMLRGSGVRHTILRPGAILGPDRVTTAHLGPAAGGTLILMERGGEVPAVSLADCARAFVLAAEMPGEGRALNIIGADRPTRARYAAALRRTGWPRRVLPLNWRLVMPLAWLLSPLGARLPGLLRPAVLRARMRPVRYDIAAAEVALDWQPQDDFETAFSRAVEGGG